MGWWERFRAKMVGLLGGKERKSKAPFSAKSEPQEIIWGRKIMEDWSENKIDEVLELYKKEIFYTFTHRSPEDYSYQYAYLDDVNPLEMQERYWKEYGQDYWLMKRNLNQVVNCAEKIMCYSNGAEDVVVSQKSMKAQKAIRELTDYVYLARRVTDQYICHSMPGLIPKDPNPLTEAELTKFTEYCLDLQSDKVKADALLRIAKVKETLALSSNQELYVVIVRELKKMGKGELARRLSHKYLDLKGQTDQAPLRERRYFADKGER